MLFSTLGLCVAAAGLAGCAEGMAGLAADFFRRFFFLGGPVPAEEEDDAEADDTADGTDGIEEDLLLVEVSPPRIPMRMRDNEWKAFELELKSPTALA